MGDMAEHDAEVYGFAWNGLKIKVPGAQKPAVATASVLRNQMAALAAEVARIEALPKEPDAKVIRFKKKFTAYGRQQWYSYAAMKVGSTWYVTGRVTTPFTWNELLAFIGDEYLHTIRVAAGWQKLGTEE